MKKVLKIIYILDTIFLYFVLFIFLLWSIFHTLNHFPPKIEAIIIFFFTIFSFIALIKILLRRAKSYHLLESIVLPTTIIMSFLYYLIPMMVQVIPILEKEHEKNGNSAIDFGIMLSSLELVIANHKELTFLDQLFMLFSYETLPFMILVMIMLSINFIGNYKIYLTPVKLITPKQTKKGLLG